MQQTFLVLGRTPGPCAIPGGVTTSHEKKGGHLAPPMNIPGGEIGV